MTEQPPKKRSWWRVLAAFLLLFGCGVVTAFAFLPAEEDPTIPLAEQGGAVVAHENITEHKRAEEALRLYIEKGAPLGHEDEIRDFLQMRQASPINPG